MTHELLDQVHRAFQSDDSAEVRRLLDRHPALKERINDPVGEFGDPPITLVRSRAMLDVLLEAGADIDALSTWWAGGFGLLDRADSDLAEYAIGRGAVVTIHAAARLGMMSDVRLLLEDRTDLVHARGGDGQTPLHVASSVEVAALLLDRGADIDARDVDHLSTPAQYMVRSRQDVARFLIQRGCESDVLMAAALGDADLARRHLDRDPACIRMRVSDEYFPMVDSHAGGTIYQWELGWHVSAAQVAQSFGHIDLFDELMEGSPPDEVLVNACWLHDADLVRSVLGRHPELPGSISSGLRRHVAHAARNNDGRAALLMLDAGLSPSGAFSQHHGTALHWAAWHGNAGLVRRILEGSPSLEDDDNAFRSTPLGWAVHGSEHGWSRSEGDYTATVEALIAAGAEVPPRAEGTPEVHALLRQHGTS